MAETGMSYVEVFTFKCAENAGAQKIMSVSNPNRSGYILCHVLSISKSVVYNKLLQLFLQWAVKHEKFYF